MVTLETQEITGIELDIQFLYLMNCDLFVKTDSSQEKIDRPSKFCLVSELIKSDQFYQISFQNRFQLHQSIYS